MEPVVWLKQKDAIGIVAMEDRQFKNTFSKRFIMDIKQVFAEIRDNSQLKVVVIHGYDSYFNCGGTKEELLKLNEGVGQEGDKKKRFADLQFHDILLNCEVPVIAAMQGHALGGGLAFGSFADIMVLGIECIYSANFMKYGFTPGMGATYIIPKKFGTALGNEMLYTAGSYYGQELKERGAPLKIVRKHDVIDTALEIAKTLAEKPLLSLKILKDHLTREIKKRLPGIIEEELHMHEKTFGQPGVRQRIERLFGN
jgi:polyketide biosynthesis enoyl-CoA hydratase PksI